MAGGARTGYRACENFELFDTRELATIVPFPSSAANSEGITREKERPFVQIGWRIRKQLEHETGDSKCIPKASHQLAVMSR